MTTALSFSLPSALEASEPPEARGLTRDAVRMLVAHRGEGRLVHSTFSLLPVFLDPGDLVVVNTSGTLAAAVDGTDATGRGVEVHFSTELDQGLWVLEPRRPSPGASEPWGDGEEPPKRIVLVDGGAVELLEPYQKSGRLWVARVCTPAPVTRWLAVHGRPIRYRYVERPWPISSISPLPGSVT